MFWLVDALVSVASVLVSALAEEELDDELFVDELDESFVSPRPPLGISGGVPPLDDGNCPFWSDCPLLELDPLVAAIVSAIPPIATTITATLMIFLVALFILPLFCNELH